MGNPMERVKALNDAQDSFRMDEAVVVFDHNGEFREVVKDGDIYTALTMVKALGSNWNADGMAVITTGWAAPLNNGEVEGAPSEHPDRQRVRLTCYISNDGVASALSFENGDDTVYDEGDAVGRLADMIQDAWLSL